MWLVAWSINGAFHTRSIANFGAPCEIGAVRTNPLEKRPLVHNGWL